jgi:hypothetical protein
LPLLSSSPLPRHMLTYADEEEATSPAAPEDSTERELLRQKRTSAPVKMRRLPHRHKKERRALRQLIAFLSAADQAAWRNCPYSGWSCTKQQCWHCNARQ